MTKIKIKKLNLDEMWKLYNLLKSSVENREPEGLVINELFKIIEKSPPQSLLNSIYLLYGNKIKINSPIEFNQLFTQGLMQNQFLEFCAIVRGLHGNSK